LAWAIRARNDAAPGHDDPKKKYLLSEEKGKGKILLLSNNSRLKNNTNPDECKLPCWRPSWCAFSLPVFVLKFKNQTPENIFPVSATSKRC